MEQATERVRPRQLFFATACKLFVPFAQKDARLVRDTNHGATEFGI